MYNKRLVQTPFVEKTRPLDPVNSQPVLSSKCDQLNYSVQKVLEAETTLEAYPAIYTKSPNYNIKGK